MRTKLPLLQESRKGRRRLGWQSPKSVADTAPTEDSDAPSKVPPDSKLPETPKPSETQSRYQVIDIQVSQKICKQWEAEMEGLNAKYNLDCFFDSKLNSESNEGEQYKYEHGYEALI